MTANLHFEEAYISLFRTILSSVSDLKKDFIDSLLINLITTIKNKENDLKLLHFNLEENPSLFLSMDTDDFFDTLIIMEDNFLPLMKLASKNKDKSDVFFQFYSAIDSLYTTIVYVSIEIGFLESEFNNSNEILNAS